SYLKRCVRKGLVKVGQAPRRRYAYYLTPQGFAEKSRLTARYLAHSFSFFRRARAQCGEIFASAAARGQRRLALVGGGDLAEIASLFAREYPVEIAGVITVCAEADQLSAAVAAVGTRGGPIRCRGRYFHAICSWGSIWRAIAGGRSIRRLGSAIWWLRVTRRRRFPTAWSRRFGRAKEATATSRLGCLRVSGRG